MEYNPSNLTLNPDLHLKALIHDQILTAKQSFKFSLPRELFGYDAFVQGVKFEATRVDGSALPYWLHFDPKHLKFTGTPPDNANNIEVMVTLYYKGQDLGQIFFKILVAKDKIGNRGNIQSFDDSNYENSKNKSRHKQ